MGEVKSIYRVGAEKGAWFGIYLSVLSIMLMYGFDSVLLMYASIALFLGIPGVAYFYIRKYHVSLHCMSQFSALWMLGILIFLFGSLICGVVTYVWMQYVEPTFIYDQVQMAIKLYESVPGENARMLTDILKQAVENHMLPSAIDIVIEMIMLTTFVGSIISMIISAIVRLKRV